MTDFKQHGNLKIYGDYNKAPKWLLNAKVNNGANASIISGGKVVWHDGHWNGGTWKDGVWEKSHWHSGKWITGLVAGEAIQLVNVKIPPTDKNLKELLAIAKFKNDVKAGNHISDSMKKKYKKYLPK